MSEAENPSRSSAPRVTVEDVRELCGASTPHRFRRSNATIRQSNLDHLIIQLYISGGVRGDYGATPIDAGAGSISLLDLGRTVESGAPGFSNINLIVPRDKLPLSLRKRDLHGVILDPKRGSTRLLASHLSQLFHEGSSLSEPERAAAVSAALVMVEGGLFALQDSEVATQRAAGRAVKHAIEKHIDRHLFSAALSPERIAASFHLSRASLYRLFEDSGGVQAHIQRRRLEHAFDALTQPGRMRLGIGEMAYHYGFDSESAFSRAFRRRFAISPRDARALGQARMSAPRQPSMMSSETDLIDDWLSALGTASSRAS